MEKKKINFGKKLAIIGLIIFGVGVPSTATTMSSSLFDLPFGMQQSSTIDGLVIYPDEPKNIKHTFRGHNPVLVSFEVNPQDTPYSVIVTNYEWSDKVLNIVESGSAEHRIEHARVGTYDFNFVNLGDEELYLSIDITDAEYGDRDNPYRYSLQLMIYIYYAVFFGGIIVGSTGIIIWRMTK